MSADTDRLVDQFRRTFGQAPVLIAEAPGRVNLIGEHTDYNDGFVLPVAIDRTVAVAAHGGAGSTVRVQSIDFRESDEFTPALAERLGGSDWRNYVRGAAWALEEAGCRLGGAELAICGDVPQGTGLSSSAAIEVAVAGVLARLNGCQIAPRDIASAARRAENVFAGVQCGIMDQFAAALSRASCALLIDCRSLETEALPLPADVAIVIVDSKVPRRLEETGYNRRREECAEAACLLGSKSLREVTGAQLEDARDRLPDPLYKRARHVLGENARVLAAAKALRRVDTKTLGDLMFQSHESLRADFEVSCPELDLLVDLARDVDGVAGARLTGAGFGGCTVNLMKWQAVEAFRERVLSAYGKRTGLAAETHVCRAVEGLRVTDV